jgi:DNA-binding protein HU-beta
MNRSELVRAMAIKSSLNQEQSREALDTLVDLLAWAAHENEDVTVAGFGKFLVRNRPEAERQNPGTGEKVTVPARKTVTFRASQTFRDRL